MSQYVWSCLLLFCQKPSGNESRLDFEGNIEYEVDEKHNGRPACRQHHLVVADRSVE